MTDTIAGVEIPDTTAVAEATDFLRERTNPLICHHSRRVFLFGSLNARKFLLDRGFSEGAAELVWRAIALHTTPGIPGRMEPEVAVTNYGGLTDAIGCRLDRLDGDRLDEIVTARPRDDFEKEFLQAFVDGLKDRPDTTYGTVNADVLEHFVTGFGRGSLVERVLGAPWPR
ncbi:diguanylate cyclase [Streptomyces sp. NPDC007251]|uniref:diguanylate cyclase n=1 Tax=Streptomyces sp. NPDC007251 TaxID=3154483 RepID=UPI0033D20741